MANDRLMESDDLAVINGMNLLYVYFVDCFCYLLSDCLKWVMKNLEFRLKFRTVKVYMTCH